MSAIVPFKTRYLPAPRAFVLRAYFLARHTGGDRLVPRELSERRRRAPESSWLPVFMSGPPRRGQRCRMRPAGRPHCRQILPEIRGVSVYLISR